MIIDKIEETGLKILEKIGLKFVADWYIKHQEGMRYLIFGGEALAPQKLYMYSEDINKALEIVDNTLIHKIMSFRKELGIDVEIMIYEDEIYFRFFTGNIISVNLFDGDSEKKILYYYYRIIQFIVEFSDEVEKR